MKILIVIKAVLPAVKYGGTERVMWYLGKELSLMGHEVHFLAEKGSVIPFAKVHVLRNDIPISQQIPQEVDVVHFNNHVPQDFTLKPYIVTYHGNSRPEEIDRKHAVFVSRNHAMRYGCDSFVYNGLDWNDYGPLNESEPRTYFHFLGKAAWRVKNVRGAVRMIKQLPNERLYVLGGYRFNFYMGWRFTFTPKARFKGMVGREEKVGYLQHSKGLFFPVVWDEPFGLAITESLYCGAPVFGSLRGSLPELVNREVGYLSNDENELVNHIKDNYNYSPRRCHEYAAELFNSRRMAEAYLVKYEQALSQ